MTQPLTAAPSLIARIADRFFRTRWLVRMPIGLYRAGLGFLFGKRLLMLEHTGRKSGARRRVVLEVLDRPAPGEYVIIAGFAGKAQWYRNITANPHVRVSTGFKRNMTALAEPMSQAESAAMLRDFTEHHPAEWKKMQGIFEHVSGRPVDTMPMVRLRVQSDATPANGGQVPPSPEPAANPRGHEPSSPSSPATPFHSSK